MRVLVYGNINAGKSRVAASLRRELPNTRQIAIDDYRRTHGDGTLEGDRRAMERFVSDAAATEDSVVECTGLGPLGNMLHHALPPKASLVVHVRAPVGTCLARSATKDFSSTPYPPFQESIDETIRRCDEELRRGDLETLWHDRALWIVAVDGTATDTDKVVEQLPLLQLAALSNITATAHRDPAIDALIWYGSGPRGEMTRQSDIDLFALTALPVGELAARLAASVTGVRFCDTIGSKVTLRLADATLVEANSSARIDDVAEYYRHAGLRDAHWSVLKGDARVQEQLAAIASEEPVPDVDALVSELVYYTLSLGPLGERGDSYKYSFHLFIVRHDIVRLKAIEAGRTARNYLPVEAEGLLTPDEWKALGYRVGERMRQHRTDVTRFAREFIATVAIDVPRRTEYLEYLDEEVDAWGSGRG